MKRIGLVMILLLSMLLCSCSLLPEEETFMASPVIKDYAYTPYKFSYAERGDMALTEKITLNYVPVQTAQLGFAVDGEYYDEVYVESGETVQVGQLLAQLRIDDYVAQLEACGRQIDSINLSISQLEERRVLALERARMNADAQTMEEALRNVNESYDDQRAQLEDQLFIQTAYRESAAKRIEERQLRAPFQGTITYARKLQDGQRSKLNERVVSIADSTMSLFRANTKSWMHFVEGTEYTIIANKNEYQAVVTSEEALGIEPTDHEEGKNGYVYLMLTQPAFDLEEGDRGSMTLVLDSRTDVVMIPKKAIIIANNEPIIYYQNEQGVKAYKYIKTGLEANGMIEVVEGLSEGDGVIVE